ncbi:putative tetratricopeptide-like helical domain superfamily, protein NPG1 [Helianthus debilis subsp. tardiflorus]
MKLENEMIRSSESLAVNDYSSDANDYSSQATGENDKKIDTGNIEEAESSLRENGSLNYEEARALLGRYEYQKGNIEAALHVFEGIDLATVVPKMKTSLTQRSEPRKKVSHNYGDPPLSTHAVGLLLEAIYLKSKSLQMLQRYKEAAQSCKVILDIIESSLPEGLPENFGTDCKLQETLNHAIELLPELWKLAGSPQEAVLSFRRALLHHQTLNAETTAKIQKDFAYFLLYNGGEEAVPPNLRIVYNLSLENAEQRKLDVALSYAKRLVKLEGGSSVKGWILLARILSGQKRFSEGETVINAALEQTGKWDQGELLRTKARLQVAQGEIKNAIQTYTQILAVLQVQGKSFRSQKKNHEIGGKHLKSLEMETWHDLAMVYMKLSQWSDAEACLLKSESIYYYSASRLHITGLLYEAKGLDKEAQKAYELALDMDPGHVASLVSLAVIIRRAGVKPAAAAKSFLTEALRLDRLNSLAWYNLGLFYKEDGPMFMREAANCFEAASILEETEPIEPFR